MTLYLIEDTLNREVYVMASCLKNAVKLYDKEIGNKILHIEVLTDYILMETDNDKEVKDGE